MALDPLAASQPLEQLQHLELGLLRPLREPDLNGLIGGALPRPLLLVQAVPDQMKGTMHLELSALSISV